jgi:aspartyl-tRNA(Asn)/glutamyl-tRNA(Gln) amidotransferase subunit A
VASDGKIFELSLLQLSERLERRELSALEATEACLLRLAAVEPRVHAFLRVDQAGARAAARASDARRAAGRTLSPLDGIPIGLKDLLLTEGVETTAGSLILKGFIPPYDATVVRRLKETGAVILGKLAMDEFAMGSSNENTPFAKVHNPWDLERVPGGSSGGSAAAVAAREVFGSLGTDTGGSIRQPASFCGVVGLKPTYGRVSRYGVVAFASSLDQVGPMARTVGDCAELLQAFAGYDPLDSTSSDQPVPLYRESIGQGIRGLKIGLPKEFFRPGMDAEVEQRVREGVEVLSQAGAEVREVSLPHSDHAVATYYIVATAEASSNLARYDGVKYGHRAEGVHGLRELYLRSRAEGFGPEVKRRILLGTYVLSHGYYDAYYLKAQRVRALIARDFAQAFEQVDVIVGPTSPTAAFRLGEKSADPLQMYLADIFTIPCNLADLPGMSVPCGFTKAGLPVGFQILGRSFDEPTLLRVGDTLERALQISSRSPELGP